MTYQMLILWHQAVYIARIQSTDAGDLANEDYSFFLAWQLELGLHIGEAMR